MDAMSEMHGPRELEISSEVTSGDQVLVSVRDTGAGLDPETRLRVFEPFFTTKPAGTGMGLSICRSIMEAHQGRIWVESLDRGTVFHFTLGSNS
jgi:signal transduction histidine kinase